jgi:hypothetical protein
MRLLRWPRVVGALSRVSKVIHRKLIPAFLNLLFGYFVGYPQGWSSRNKGRKKVEGGLHPAKPLSMRVSSPPPRRYATKARRYATKARRYATAPATLCHCQKTTLLQQKYII